MSVIMTSSAGTLSEEEEGEGTGVLREEVGVCWEGVVYRTSEQMDSNSSSMVSGRGNGLVAGESRGVPLIARVVSGVLARVLPSVLSRSVTVLSRSMVLVDEGGGGACLGVLHVIVSEEKVEEERLRGGKEGSWRSSSERNEDPLPDVEWCLPTSLLLIALWICFCR